MKRVEAEIKIDERTLTIKEKNKSEQKAIGDFLLNTAAEKLLVRLMENDIY